MPELSGAWALGNGPASGIHPGRFLYLPIHTTPHSPPALDGNTAVPYVLPRYETSVPLITRWLPNAQSTAECNASRKTVMIIIYNAINSHIKMLETIATTIHYTQVYLVKTTITFSKHKHATCQHSSSSNCNGIGGHITEMYRPTEALCSLWSAGRGGPCGKSSHTLITLNNIVAVHMIPSDIMFGSKNIELQWHIWPWNMSLPHVANSLLWRIWSLWVKQYEPM